MSRTASLKLIVLAITVLLCFMYIPTEHSAVIIACCLVAALVNAVARSIIDAYVEN